MNVVVFCSAQIVSELYSQSAIDLGSAIAKAGHSLVWGGSNIGLMKLIADSVQENGGKLIGVTFKEFEHKLRPDINEVHVMNDLSERKNKLEEIGDAFIALPGGIGTLDELTHIASDAANGRTDAVVHLLNINGFYENLYNQLLTMESNGFLKHPVTELVKLNDNIDDLMSGF